MNLRKEKLVFLITIATGIALYLFTESDYTVFIIFACLIYGIFAFICSRVTGRKLDISLDISHCEQNPVISVKIKNRSLLPVLAGRAALSAVNLMTEEAEDTAVSFSAGSHKTKEIQIQLTEFRCGCIKISAGVVTVSDPLEIFEKNRTYRAQAEYYALPAVNDLEISKEELSKYDMESYKYSSVKKGEDLSETFSIREYAEGDGIKGIHWKLSGKMGRLMIRVPSLPVENSLMVILDKRYATEEDRAEKAEEAAKLFLSISDTLKNQGLRHCVGWYDYISCDFVSREIDNQDRLREASLKLISTPFREDEVSGADRFLEADIEKQYASYIYVTDSEKAERDIERLREYGEVKIYRPKNFI